jgi:hypothetical protein
MNGPGKVPSLPGPGIEFQQSCQLRRNRIHRKHKAGVVVNCILTPPDPLYPSVVRSRLSFLQRER